MQHLSKSRFIEYPLQNLPTKAKLRNKIAYFANSGELKKGVVNGQH